MEENCFNFLDDGFGEISEECFYCEKHLVNKDYKDSIFRAGTAAEKIVTLICEIENLDYLSRQNQKRKIKGLVDIKVIPVKLEGNFEFVRRARNNAAHRNINDLGVRASEVHKKLYEIAVWFYKKYGDENFEAPDYNGLIFRNKSINTSNGELGNETNSGVLPTGQEIPETIENTENKDVGTSSETDNNKDVAQQTTETSRDVEQEDQKLSEIKNRINDSINEVYSEVYDGDIIDMEVGSNLKNYTFQKYDGSYLLNELTKLKDSSREAVESDDNLNDFKKYLHVNRSIQDEFIKELKRVQDKPSSHLVMLCGSVGDGKSHMLAYLKTYEPELFNKFTIHNDATESQDPEETAIDTLANVLKSFNDENIENSFEKFILAINLGVLNNFLESDYCKNEYTKLKEIIDDANLFDSKTVTENRFYDHVSFITFSDYNLFELNNNEDSNYVSSNYLSALFNNVINKSDNNPFYLAYNLDKRNGLESSIIDNYEFFSNENNQEIIIEYLIKVFNKYKKIISTRDLLNFVYEIIVPPETDKEDLNLNNLLPNLLFNDTNRSSLLELFNDLDPTIERSEELDKFIIDLYINDDINKVLDKYYFKEEMSFLEPYFADINNTIKTETNKKSYKTGLISPLIRLAIFYGKPSIKKAFKDETYLKYLKYLYNYNIGNIHGYKRLFNEVKDSIFKWKESEKKNYVCVDELDSFKILKKIYLKPSSVKQNNSKINNENNLDNVLGNRFKNEIELYFKVSDDFNENKIPITVDFQLYKYITKINHGFKLNVNEKEKLTVYNQFVESIIEGQNSKTLIIKYLESNEEFLFEYNDDFDTFEFRSEV
ncbi:DNA phosphorothioation-dependent restriction protein DptF [Methanobrevibacter wolinii]|uniref:DNA phosphorothioation-dependent restriction protein DptF n=1 Tax=Methanobrevibacter wolinii TaxID=190977 RepID=UPI0005B27654|nr:DNA phosphorothioation-dependent restriction protein DptF [Methanobrevibacter wolinii]